MFNRSTKLTALLVAAASVASMTPVMAAEKLNQKDGTIKNGVAYDNGKYAYYGYKDKDKDDNGIWYNSGSGSDKAIKDLEEYEITEKYGTKYAYATEDGNKDEYLIDLSKGTIADDESAEDKENSARGKLISKLKKFERYNTISDSQYDITDRDVATTRLFKNQFGDVWYQYVTTNNGANFTGDMTNYYGQVKATTGGNVQYFGDTTTDSAVAFTGFFNEKGDFIDVSDKAGLKIYSARKNKAVSIEKYGKLYKDEALKVNLKSVQALAQDKDNIYALVTVDVDYYINKSGQEGVYQYDFTNPVEHTDYEKQEQRYIQKISKATEKEDDTYVPKTISSYQLDDKSIWDDGDMKDAYNAVFDTDAEKQLFAVKDGDLYVTREKNDNNIKVTKIKLTKNKVDLMKDYDSDSNGKNDSNEFAISTLGEKKAKGKDIDISVAKKDADNDKDTELGLKSTSIDVSGNTWVIDEGKIYMFDKDEFKQQYSTDRSYNRLDVYDKNSLIAWDDEKDSYTTVQEGKKQTVDDAQVIDPNLVNKDTVAPAHAAGWEKQANGVDWKLYDVTGKEVTGWTQLSGVWYYLDPATKLMKTGWVQPNGAGTTWYYLDASGAMKTGWFQDTNGLWYYLDPASGAMKTGWFQDYTGTWYYCYGDGHMASNTYVDGYWLNGSGAWV